jgi:subtilisin family serine protease
MQGVKRALWAVCLTLATSVTAKTIDGAFIVELSKTGGPGQLDSFRAAAAESALNYTIRHEYDTANVFVGLSVRIGGGLNDTAAQAQLAAIPGVQAVHPVHQGSVPSTNIVNGTSPYANTAQPFVAGAVTPPVPSPGPHANLSSALQMAGVDKLHAAGINGQGVKVGIVDTGVDYRNPALGGGFGPGFKIVGGYSYTNDAGQLVNSSDPLATCYGGGHGTHVAGIIGMNPLAPGKGFNISGVAPGASLYMYRVFGCDTSNGGGSDDVIYAFLQAQKDGVSIINLSVNFGTESEFDIPDPAASVIQSLHDAGIAVVVAMGNSAAPSATVPELFNAGDPSELSGSVGVGAVANTNFPLQYTAKDSSGSSLQYGALWPLGLASADVYNVTDGCTSDNWVSALSAVGSKVNSTVFAFPITDACRPADANDFGGQTPPPFLLGYYLPTTNPYYFDYDVPSTGYFGSAQLVLLNGADSTTFQANYQKVGGYGKYKLTFNNGTFASPPQHVGGFVDYYSDFGPVWHTYELKPQFASPGGHVLSTWPLGQYGNYTILSGTSMATPYITGCYALLRQKFPTATVDQLTALLQTNARQLPWVFNPAILSATSQQGAGLVNAYAAANADSKVTPGQLTISDNSPTVYGVANISIANDSPATKTYVLSHQGAGYEDLYPNYMESAQVALYGSAHFPTPTVTVAPSKTVVVPFTVVPPPSASVTPTNFPVFGGFIGVQEEGSSSSSSSSSSSYHVSYVGPPFSLYNAEYFVVVNTSSLTLPRIYYEPDGSDPVYDTGFLQTNASIAYGSTIATLQWTTALRIDVVPANLTSASHNPAFVPTHYGYDPHAALPAYQAPTAPLRSRGVGGVPSYGWLRNQTGLVEEGDYSPTGVGLSVTGDDGGVYALGPGDYRWLASVLRWGGEPGLAGSWETWLGPVVRVVDGPVPV